MVLKKNKKKIYVSHEEIEVEEFKFMGVIFKVAREWLKSKIYKFMGIVLSAARELF